MQIRTLLYIVCICTITSCSVQKDDTLYKEYVTTQTKLTLVDESRNRTIPVAIYAPKTEKPILYQKVVIFSHGYGKNSGNAYLGYSFLTNYLASKGYLVVSVQHEQAGDPRLPKKGNMMILRMPFWDRGADNIHYVLQTLKKNHGNIDQGDITLIGHSNGGDMSAFYPTKYPNEIKKIITLDNRRMPLPKSKKIKVLSLRSCDQPADEGVLPTAKEQRKFKIKVVQMHSITHNDMCNNASPTQRKHMLKYIDGFMRD